MEIDFVITWVNMDDPEWQKEFAKYSGKTVTEKNSVTVTIRVKNLRPEKVLRESGYAHRQLIPRFTAVPTTV